ncbi:MAG: metal-independent alpha-mannosidase, partial [Ferruginibacter sp.]
MKRRQFIGNTSMLCAGLMMNKKLLAAETYPIVRVNESARKFTSQSVEKAITEFKAQVKDPELCWLFENCFPNTLDTTV